MTEPPPNVVPYVEWHQGPRRTVTFDLSVQAVFGGSILKAKLAPVVSIDGRQYVVYWGQVTFEIPADRAVHVAVSLEESAQAASLLLPPGQSLALDYAARQGGQASLAVRPPQA